ncbi:MAG: tRNA (N(6)-L-threonylcarbamoyladenosine(37)-C(2))-methylthiotransferase MtaB [Peptococcaceae bacterium]|jgi:threonylcarbamoyladenosine tRNA methylthiotransferase MtaB|nr:tRNA (N(6)-L-threonylcarbamoyladenosine(37)-C(2))-methylthiotransferase MtaB [Peptococcaceae bacterium]
MNTPPKVALTTLGCKVNQTESEAIAQLFREAGYRIIQPGEQPDVVVVNTCSVTDTGDRKSRQRIRRMIRAYPDSLTVVMGCYAQACPQEIMGIEGVDLVIGTQGRSQILALIDKVKAERQACQVVLPARQAREFEELPLLWQESRTRATIKIQDGCNQFCTYCLIPYVRGPNRSRDPQRVLAEIAQIAAAGYGEIVLTGIHTGAYGQDLEQAWDLARLIQESSAVSGLRRLRLGSIEPMEFTSRLLDTIAATPLVCPHLHIPLQSGSDAVLARMKRPYRLRDYAQLLDKLYVMNPELSVSTDIITGFPGESATDHAHTLAFLQDCRFSGMHVFPYSKRQGTPAAAFPDQISKSDKERRSGELLRLDQELKRAYRRQFIGREAEILVERVSDSAALGHTPHYLAVRFPVKPEQTLTGGSFTRIILTEEYFV